MKNAVLIVSILFFCELKAQNPFELFGGSKYTVFDIRIFNHFESNSRFSIFSKNLFELDKKGRSTFDVLQNVNFTLSKHFGIVTAIRLNDKAVSWRNGLRFISETKDFIIIGQIVYEWSTSRDRIAYLWNLRTKTPKNKSKLYCYVHLDFLGGFSRSNFDYLNSTERLRIGLGINSLQFGFATNQEQSLVELNNKLENSENYGVFFRKVF